MHTKVDLYALYVNYNLYNYTPMNTVQIRLAIRYFTYVLLSITNRFVRNRKECSYRFRKSKTVKNRNTSRV